MADEYFIGIGLPEKEESVIAKIKQDYHPKHHLSSPPHLTLVSPFSYTDENELKEIIKNFVNQQKDFRLSFDTIEVFTSHETAVVISPENKTDISNMANSLRELFPISRIGKFYPHITLSQNVAEEKIESVIRGLKNRNLYFNFEVKEIILYKRKIGESWQEEKRFTFKVPNEEKI